MAFINIQLERHNIYIGTVPIKLFAYVHIVWIRVEQKTFFKFFGLVAAMAFSVFGWPDLQHKTKL